VEALKVEKQLDLVNVTPRWSLAGRILFRLTFVYLLLFILFGGNSPLLRLWDGIVLWVGKHVFDVAITFRPLGSGDTTWNYVQLFCFLVVAAGTSFVWSLLDRKRINYQRLDDWLRVIVRYSLAMTMIFYGIGKFTQFPSPSHGWLVQPLGDSSPMRLLWAFMGASPAYTYFTGGVELLGGLLLVFRRTTLLGALVCLAATTQVVLLNYCYDVPVKILSSHLLLMTVFLLLPHLRRLADLFLFNRVVTPAEERPLFTRRWLARCGLALRTVLFTWVVGSTLLLNVTLGFTVGDQAPKPPLYGVWNVEKFEVDGKVRPALLTDKVRWRRMIVDFPGAVAIQDMSDARRYYALDLTGEGRTLDLSDPGDSAWHSRVTCTEPEPGLLALEGTFDGRKVRAALRRTDRSDFLLVKRGFHWINEVPFNR
jgi:uncharacterized membrane protein YphA (DoxX/SURF4 family)